MYTNLSRSSKKIGYNHQLTYSKSINNKNEETKQRKRKIIWFNPPYSKNVSTKVVNQFLKLINKHFPWQHKLYKLFNKNNVKVRLIRITCDCIRKQQCPINVLYKVSITPNEENSKTKIYYSNSETAFKNQKKHSITSIKLIQNYQTNIGISYQQTDFEHILGNFGNPQIIQPKF